MPSNRLSWAEVMRHRRYIEDRWAALARWERTRRTVSAQVKKAKGDYWPWPGVPLLNPKESNT